MTQQINEVLAKGHGWRLYYCQANKIVSPMPGLSTWDYIDLVQDAKAIGFFVADDFGDAVEVDGYAYQMQDDPYWSNRAMFDPVGH